MNFKEKEKEKPG